MLKHLLGGALLGLFPLFAAALDMSGAEIVAMRCGECHGRNGQATSPIYPSLAGQNAQYLRKQLQDFVSGRRSNETMSPQAKDLTETNIQDLADYFAGLPPRQTRTAHSRSVSVGRQLYMDGMPGWNIPACATCHGDNAHGSATLPRLAGQNARYLTGQLQEFEQRVRGREVLTMHDIMTKLGDEEAKALVDYLSQLP